MGMISLIGLYNYDTDLFQEAVFPEEMNRDVIIDNILMECAELEVLYASPVFMKNAIGRWSHKELKVWEKLYSTELLTYNPLWNVDADITETESITRNKSGSSSGSDNDSRTITGRDEDSRTINSSVENNRTESREKDNTGTDADTGTNIEAVTGYNSTTWQDHTKNTNSNTKTLNLKEIEDTTISESGENTDSESGTRLTNSTDSGTRSTSGEFDENEGTEITRSTRRTGNIGVTSSMELLRQEREVDQFNTIDYIINSFKKRFCLLVY